MYIYIYSNKDTSYCVSNSVQHRVSFDAGGFVVSLEEEQRALGVGSS